MSFVRCFSTLGCPEASLAEALEIARRHQISALELRVLNGSLDLPAASPRAASAWWRSEPR